MTGGDALIDDADAEGKWVFRKKDGSTWGKIYMPWTYSRWIRAYAVVRDAMPPARRARWEKALRLGYAGISRELRKARLVNIPAHHAMGLYFAGRLLNEPAWSKQAAEFLHRVVAQQHADGYWSEHVGPVVLYNTVYCERPPRSMRTSPIRTVPWLRLSTSATRITMRSGFPMPALR
jgi:hypothetical protein